MLFITGKNMVEHADFEFAYDKQTLGLDLKNRVRDLEDRTITAYHEAGHTLVGYFTKHADPLHKVTIVAKGQTGGHAKYLPKKQDSWHQTRAQLLAKMDVAMGGRAAEELIFGKELVTGGASSDLENATNITNAMIKSLAMSEKMGLRTYSIEDFANGVIGDQTKALIDDEINAYLNDSYKRAMHLLKSHRKELDLLADALLQYETLDAEEVKAVIEGKQLNKKSNANANVVETNKGKITPSPLVGLGDSLVHYKNS